MGNEFLEKRRHKRYAVPENTVAYCHNKLGLVINISKSGMAINFLDWAELFSDEMKIDLLCKTTKTLIKGLPLKQVRVEDIKFSDFGGFATRTVRTKFNTPSTIQQAMITHYICGLS